MHKSALVIGLFLLLSMASAWSGGSGTADNPWQITNCTELQNISNDLQKHFIITQNIDCSATSSWNWNGSHYQGFEPIGGVFFAADEKFEGTLDGGGYNISDLYIYRLEGDGITVNQYKAMIGYASHASITDVHLTSVNITGCDSSGVNVGCSTNAQGTSSLIAYAGFTNISYCSATGEVNGENHVGGLVGSVGSSKIEKSWSSVNITGGRGCGGLGGWIQGTITDVFANGSVKCNNLGADSDSVGGLVGLCGKGANLNITNAYSTSSVQLGDHYGGGVCGTADGLNLDNIFTTSDVSGGLSSYMGGIIGDSNEADCVSCNFDNIHWNSNQDESAGSENITGSIKQATKSFFYNISNVPMTSWDFTNIWSNRLDGVNYPPLQPYSSSGTSTSTPSYGSRRDYTEEETEPEPQPPPRSEPTTAEEAVDRAIEDAVVLFTKFISNYWWFIFLAILITAVIFSQRQEK